MTQCSPLKGVPFGNCPRIDHNLSHYFSVVFLVFSNRILLKEWHLQKRGKYHR